MRWNLDWLENRAKITPEGEAVVDAEQNLNWSYYDLNQRARSLANWLLQKGVQKGDRIALLSPNDISYFDFLFACGKIGAIFVPLNWRLSKKEISYILSDCMPKLMGVHSDAEHLIEGNPIDETKKFYIDKDEYETIIKNFKFRECDISINEEDPIAMIYTGGTTGKPKGVVLSHRAILWNGINTVISWNLTNCDTTVTFLPMFHTGGLNALSIPILMAGGKVVIAKDFTPEKAAFYLNQYLCTIVLFVPTMYHMLVKTEEFKKSGFPSVKMFLSGGAPCPLEIYEKFKTKGLAFKEGYGLTEAGPNNFYISPEDAEKKRGSVGKPMVFNTVKIIDDKGKERKPGEVGELLIKGKHTFSSYWHNDEATSQALREGWLYTGDLAKKDDDGFFYIVGRKKEMIITGGENVYPLEVEQWISSHPEVNEVAVVGFPDEKWGELVTAFVSLHSPAGLSEEELQRYCRLSLGAYKVPKKIIFLDELPKTHVGKIDKKCLRGMEFA